MSKLSTKRNSCTFVESSTNVGLVEQVRKLAAADGRSLSNYIGIILQKHVNKQNESNTSTAKNTTSGN
jgi:hypothetical protein